MLLVSIKLQMSKEKTISRLTYLKCLVGYTVDHGVTSHADVEIRIAEPPGALFHVRDCPQGNLRR